MPLGLLAHVPFAGRIVVGAIAFVVGIGMVIGANRSASAQARSSDTEIKMIVHGLAAPGHGI
jgi:hypothetical protein